jgi:hypothetical protein
MYFVGIDEEGMTICRSRGNGGIVGAWGNSDAARERRTGH